MKNDKTAGNESASRTVEMCRKKDMENLSKQLRNKCRTDKYTKQMEQC